MKLMHLPLLRSLVRTAGLLAIASIASVASAQTVSLATSPLYASLQAHPNVVVTASVEWPTVGWAYYATDANGNKVVPAYSQTAAYVGYFDETKCYRYITNDSTNGFYFKVDTSNGTANATTHQCTSGSQFSGNFLNYATMSSIDEFRYAMTGGNRVVETTNGTIIERAFLPDGTVDAVPTFYAFNGSSGFPTMKTTANATPFATNTNVNNCKTRIFFGNGSGGPFNCNSNPDDNQYNGGFVVRVLVCDSTEGPVRTDLCKAYGTSSIRYRPVGQAQVNADKVRFGVFGYLLDRDQSGYSVASNYGNNCKYGNTWNACRYGGVLRSPMKYLGPTSYDANLTASVNPKSEINADGTLTVDPDDNPLASGVSGFINYLNKFGQTGQYKVWDPMGEMYYEAIRYFQGLQPSPEAYSLPSMPATSKNLIYDNFPVYTSWTDPIQTTCSQNYIINVSDTNTNFDSWFPGYGGTPRGNPPVRPLTRAVGSDGLNVIDWTAKVGALEAGTSSIAGGADVDANLANLSTLTTGYQYASYGSVGAAYWANTQDIRPDLAGKQTVRTINFDVNELPTGSSQGHPTKERALWLMGKYGYFSHSDTQPNPFYATNAAGATVRSNVNWEDTPGSSTPAGYVLASDPQKLIDSLRSAFAQITAASSGTAAGAAITSSSLNYGAAGTFIANFTPEHWSGTVLNASVTSTNGVLTVSSAPTWDAGLLLTARCGIVTAASTVCTDTYSGTTKRNIVTTIVQGSARVAVPFTYTNVALDANYLAALNANPSSGAADGKSQARVNYLRGYRADENSSNLFRTRDSVLGDIINSAPTYVGAPSSGISDADYQVFFSSYYNRTAAVYVGANDGMLHAFNAANGTELFAYVPNFVSTYLADLTFGGYVHEPFVDSIPVVREAKVNGSWKTVLLAGAGAGAQGVFALDVSNPNAFDSSKVLFEFTDNDDADLGNVMFPPEVVKLQTGTAAGVPTYGYFAAVTAYNNKRALCRSPGNTSRLSALLGPVAASAVPACTSNSQGDTSVSSTANNKGVLFLLSLDRTLGTAWALGTNYYKYYFPAASLTAANGLGPVSTLLSKSGSGAAAALYFGDLQGDLWRFNTAGMPSAWGPSLGTVANPQPLFVATTSTNVYQPITARPAISTGPFGSTLVTFGTGEYLGAPDLNAPYAQQSQYLLIDQNGSTAISRSANLVARTPLVSNGLVTVTGTPFSYTSNGSTKGWYIDFPGTASGERMINAAAIQPGVLAFTSLTLASNICGTGGGYEYQLSPVSGLPINGTVGGYVSTVGIPGPPAIVTLAVSNGATRGAGENIGQQTQAVLVSGTSGRIDQPGASVTQKAPPSGRVSWREITNYNDRH